LAYISDNASNCVLANDLLATWSNTIAGYVESDNEDENGEEGDGDDSEQEDPTFTNAVREAFTLPSEAIGCHAHLINLIINDSLKPINTDIVMMQRFVRKFRKNSSTRDFILGLVTSESDGVPYFRPTVDTRWKYAYISFYCYVFMILILLSGLL
jgi:hypothetical protein